MRRAALVGMVSGAEAFHWIFSKPDTQPELYVDADTPESAQTTHSIQGGSEYTLVMSDEFNQDGRNFADGHDFKWTALNRPDTVNDPLQYYKSDLVTTRGGFLDITTTNKDTTWSDWDEEARQEGTFTRHYQSGMLQGFNKFCFTGGIVEVSVQLPGPGNQPGLWPAAWLMGNLGRATFKDSSDGTWSYSYDHCSQTDPVPGASPQYGSGQRISKCNPDPGSGLRPHQGRGATEIDLFEAMADDAWSGFTSSMQLSPKLPPELRPTQGQWPAQGQWYQGMKYGKDASLNFNYYGAEEVDAISANVGSTDKKLYTEQHVFRLEWVTGEVGYIRWYLDDDFLLEIPAETLLQQYLGTPPRQLPTEPMYLLFNTAMSNNWSPVCHDKEGAAAGTRCPPDSEEPCCKIFPAHMLVDYVRIYQDAGNKDQTVGCSPPLYPTRQYIEDHADLYAPLPVHVRPPPARRGLDTFYFVLLMIGGILALSMPTYALYQRLRWRWRYHQLKDRPLSYLTFPPERSDQDDDVHEVGW